MTLKKVGVGFMAGGLLGIVLFLLVDLLPGGRAGIQSAQILGIELSIVLLLIGLWAALRPTDANAYAGLQIRQTLHGILSLPASAWVLIGFFISYLLFFVSPMFLNSTLRMIYFNRYLPERFPIGNDLIAVIDLMKGWFLANQSPYAVQFYPPFTYIFFAPLLLIGDYATLYRLFTLFTLLCYCLLTLILPVKIAGRQNLPLIVLLFITGLVSYGLQFELERGQYNVFTFLLCLWAIYIFHQHPRYRIFAYLMFSLAIQLKLYPAIFIVMFVDDWRDGKGIIRRFAGLALFNILLLFIMGYRIFLEFLRSVSSQLATPGWGWNGNHSIKAFVANLSHDGFGRMGGNTLEALRRNTGLVENLLLLAFMICFAAALLIAYRRNAAGLDPYLLITCVIGALIIPISNDYTLSILAAPVALFLSSIPEPRNLSRRLVCIVLVLGTSFVYASTLMPFKYKPYYLSNAFPPLFLILIFAAILNWIRYKSPAQDSLRSRLDDYGH